MWWGACFNSLAGFLLPLAGSGDPSDIGNLQVPPLTWLPSRRSLLSLQVVPWPLCGCCGAIFGSQSQLQLDDQDFLMRLSVDSAVMFGPGTAQLLQQARDSHGVAQEITSGLLRRSGVWSPGLPHTRWLLRFQHRALGTSKVEIFYRHSICMHQKQGGMCS